MVVPADNCDNCSDARRPHIGGAVDGVDRVWAVLNRLSDPKLFDFVVERAHVHRVGVARSDAELISGPRTRMGLLSEGWSPMVMNGLTTTVGGLVAKFTTFGGGQIEIDGQTLRARRRVGRRDDQRIGRDRN